ncbi:ketoacyl-ACP synthase III family protein [Actinomadura rudentiformis]|uniref:3-oxoacyl-ACP synthase n=1 Tax=Actinomadura rudentiformis TaxID=359158 RepID=A0A6H9YJE6_9ACTN|nr:ketoacyl-ACP synthase III family protein [Actinomadura rudentiformis]KAB2346963.1 3-oxoacyl-ACP synthase [Actinomadura rudentiformis]
MRIDDMYLAGIGVYVPEQVSTDQAVERGWYDPADQEASGMLAVTVADETPAPDMAINAARQAIEMSGLEVDDFAGLFHSNVHYQGPDGWSAHHYVLRKTLDTPVPAMELRQGCNGMLAGIQLGTCYLRAVPDRTALLLTSGDNFSTPAVDRWRSSKRFILGDGGAAVVVAKHGGFARIVAAASQSNPEMEELHRGGETLFPPGITLGQKMDLETRMEYWRKQWASGVTPPMGHMGDLVRGAVDTALNDAGMSLSDITRVAHVHFAAEALREMYMDPLGIDEGKHGTWEFARRMGHAGAVDAVAGLHHLWTSGQVGEGDHVLLLGATPGMEAGCAIVEILQSADQRTEALK